MRRATNTSAVNLDIKRSRFLGYAMPYASFDSQLDALKREHSRANHHCTAARWLDVDGRIAESAKDDGEPGGTAGRPMLRILQGNDWVDTAIIVVRYFGGVKLGTGGLARAYTQSASAALAACRSETYVDSCQTRIYVAFADLSRAEAAIAASSVVIAERSFDSNGALLELQGSKIELELLQDHFSSRSPR